MEFFMAKKRISSSDLAWIFREKMRETGACGRTVPVAIVRDGTSWMALTDKVLIKRFPRCAEQIERIQKELREIYDLRR
jgi:hypothetical protein